jgi:hypothetical protein
MMAAALTIYAIFVALIIPPWTGLLLRPALILNDGLVIARQRFGLLRYEKDWGGSVRGLIESFTQHQKPSRLVGKPIQRPSVEVPLASALKERTSEFASVTKTASDKRSSRCQCPLYSR